MFNETFEFSYSDFKSYLVCPYRYFLNREAKKISPRPRRMTDSRNYLDGWCVHKCVEVWGKEGSWQTGWMWKVVVKVIYSAKDNAVFKPIKLDMERANLVNCVMAEYIRKNFVKWRFEGDQSAAFENITAGLAKVDYWLNALGLVGSHMQPEKWFNVKLPRLNITAKGSIDLVDFRFPDLIDMKFSKSDANTDWKQLLFYDLMFTVMLNRKVRMVKTFSPLHDAPIQEHGNSKEDLQSFVEELGEVILKIRKEEFAPNNSNSSECFMCSARDSCEHGSYKYNKSVEALENTKIDEQGRKKVEL